MKNGTVQVRSCNAITIGLEPYSNVTHGARFEYPGLEEIDHYKIIGISSWGAARCGLKGIPGGEKNLVKRTSRVL